MTSPARAERAALADLLEELGPDAETINDGWAARDLAVHLVVRESRPLALPGIAIPALAPLTGHESSVVGRRRWAELLEQVRSGPPRWNPMALPPLDDAVNTTEFFIHHEDLRRAQPGWSPRTLSAELSDALWTGLHRSARLMLRRTPCRTDLVTPAGETVSAGPAGPAVTVRGEAGELVLFCSGRQRVARVHVDGDRDLVGSIKVAPLGM